MYKIPYFTFEGFFEGCIKAPLIFKLVPLIVITGLLGLIACSHYELLEPAKWHEIVYYSGLLVMFNIFTISYMVGRVRHG
jgi:hypothetical protein